MSNFSEQDNEFRRARLMPKSMDPAVLEKILGVNEETNILYPLHATRGVIFPYTPTITVRNNISYNEYHPVHSNYAHHVFEKSSPGSLLINTIFTAQTMPEARYMLACIHFFKSASKMYFGDKAEDMAGVPPPVLRFRYLGKYMYNDVPVLISDYQYSLDDKVDYVAVRFNDDTKRDTFVPTQMTITLDLKIQMNPTQVMKEFNLDEFRNGSYVNGSVSGWL